MMSYLRAALARHREEADLRRRFPTLKISANVHIRSPERLTVGRDVMLDVGVVLHCGGMGWSSEGEIILGDRSYVGPNAVLFGGGGIEVGRDALISPGVVVTSHQHSFGDTALPMREQPIDFGRIVIEDDVWIGANAVVLPGVRLGEGCVVGAGAVVTKDVPPRSVAVGVPARVAHER